MSEPISDRRFLVQFTDKAGGDWIGAGDYKTADAAKAAMDHLVDVQGKASARVLHELHYRARPFSN